MNCICLSADERSYATMVLQWRRLLLQGHLCCFCAKLPENALGLRFTIESILQARLEKAESKVCPLEERPGGIQCIKREVYIMLAPIVAVLVAMLARMATSGRAAAAPAR